MWYQNTASLPYNQEQIQNRSMGSLEKAVDFYNILPEELEERQTLLQEFKQDEHEHEQIPSSRPRRDTDTC